MCGAGGRGREGLDQIPRGIRYQGQDSRYNWALQAQQEQDGHRGQAEPNWPQGQGSEEPKSSLVKHRVFVKAKSLALSKWTVHYMMSL